MHQDRRSYVLCFNFNQRKQMKKLTALMLVLALNLGSIVHAAEGDMTKEQYIEKAVASGMDSEQAETKFADLDKNKDGVLSANEQEK